MKWSKYAAALIQMCIALSVLSASALLVGPESLYLTFRNFAQPSAPAPVQQASCRAMQAEAGTPKFTRSKRHRKTWAAEYDVATREIQTRIGLQEALFALKFTIVGGILAVLLTLSKKNPIEDFETFVQKRRAAVFFAAALLASAVVDAQLRSNIGIVIALGDWIKLSLCSFVPPDSIIWENFLHLRLLDGIFPVLRNLSHLLTAILYAVTLILFFAMPRGCHTTTRHVVWASVWFFLVLTATGASYEMPGLSPGNRMLLPFAIAFVGVVFVVFAYYLKRSSGDAREVIGAFRASLEALSAEQRHELEAQELTAESIERAGRLLDLLDSPALATAEEREEVEEALWLWYFRSRNDLRRRLLHPLRPPGAAPEDEPAAPPRQSLVTVSRDEGERRVDSGARYTQARLGVAREKSNGQTDRSGSE